MIKGREKRNDRRMHKRRKGTHKQATRAMTQKRNDGVRED